MERSLCSSTSKDACEGNKTSLWKIRKTLTEKSEGWLEFDDNNDIEKYILINLDDLNNNVKKLEVLINKVKKDSTEIKIDDYDTGSQQKVMLGYNHNSKKYYIGTLWRMKELAVGDEVGLFYDPIAKNVCFSVLKQAKSDDYKLFS